MSLPNFIPGVNISLHVRHPPSGLRRPPTPVLVFDYLHSAYNIWYSLMVRLWMNDITVATYDSAARR